MRFLVALILLLLSVQAFAQTECVAPDSSLGIATVDVIGAEVYDGPNTYKTEIIVRLLPGEQVIVHKMNSAARAEISPCAPSATWRGSVFPGLLKLTPEAEVARIVSWSDLIRRTDAVPARVWITGPGRASITYTDRDGSISQVERTLPWTHEDGVQPGTIISVTAQKLSSDYGSLRIRGYVGLRQIRSAEASSAYGVASITFVAEDDR